MKNPLDNDTVKSGLFLGSDPVEDVRHRRASAMGDDDRSDSKDSDGMDSDSEDSDGTDSDGTDSDGKD